MRRATIIGALALLGAIPASARADAALSVADVTVAESAGAATFTISASEVPAADLTVTVTTADSGARAPEDYTAVTATATILANTTMTTVTVPIAADGIDEDDEQFTLKLSGPQQSGAAPTLADDTATATITDDDPLPALSVTDVKLAEPQTGTRDARFTVKLTAASGRVVRVRVRTADRSARAPADYQAVDRTVEFAAGQTEQEVAVKVVGDDIDENTETFELRLSEAVNATIADDKGIGNFTDGDPRPSLTVSDARIPEGNGRFVAAIGVTLSARSGRTVTVTYASAGRTATGGRDFVVATSTLRIPAGELQAFIPVTVLGDRTDEPDESFLVTLSTAVNATLKDEQALAVIVDDDRPAVKPLLRGFRLRPAVIKPNGRGTLTTILNQRATLRIRLERFRPRSGSRRARWTTVRSFNVTVKPGLTRLKFAGGGLPPGSYRFVATPRNAKGLRGATRRAGFRVRR